VTHAYRRAFAVILAVLLGIFAGCSGSNEVPTPAAEQPSDTDSQAGSTQGSASSATGEPSPGGSGENPAPSATTPAKLGNVTAVRLADFRSGWVGGKGWIARTDDAGKSWRVQHQVEGAVEQVFALNHQLAWATVARDGAVDGERLLYHTKDGGKHWSLVGKVPQPGFLHFVSGQEGFVAHWRTTDGGKTWKPLPVPKQLTGDAYFHDKANGWAVTQENGVFQVMRTVDGGQSWSAVMKRETVAPLSGAVIRSAGKDDAWIQCIGGYGMNQTSYSLFHTTDGGRHWQTVIAKSTAGGGPAPGFPADYPGGPTIDGSAPGPLYVVNPDIAFMGGRCMACDLPNTIGWTKDGGKTLEKGTESFPGYGDMLLAFEDGNKGWLICSDSKEPTVMYTTVDGGKHWAKAHVFD
jgi:photosystem II stability/assembly factor-like uncharacterized protein